MLLLKWILSVKFWRKKILLDEQEERVIKKQIKECISEHENMLTRMAESQEDDFFAIYSQMGVDKFGHIIAFYGLLEKYFRIKSKKTKEEKKTLITNLTIITLDAFKMNKGNFLKGKNFFFYKQIFFIAISTAILLYSI